MFAVRQRSVGFQQRREAKAGGRGYAAEEAFDGTADAGRLEQRACGCYPVIRDYLDNYTDSDGGIMA
jgi:hypothetical protein